MSTKKVLVILDCFIKITLLTKKSMRFFLSFFLPPSVLSLVDLWFSCRASDSRVMFFLSFLSVFPFYFFGDSCQLAAVSRGPKRFSYLQILRPSAQLWRWQIFIEIKFFRSRKNIFFCLHFLRRNLCLRATSIVASEYEVNELCFGEKRNFYWIKRQ